MTLNREGTTEQSTTTRRRSEDAVADTAKGIADGVTEASRAFSDELAGTAGCTDLLERSLSGFIRASGRFLEEFGSVINRNADDLVGRGRPRRGDEDFDYERLADLVTERLRSEAEAGATGTPAPPVGTPPVTG